MFLKVKFEFNELKIKFRFMFRFISRTDNVILSHINEPNPESKKSKKYLILVHVDFLKFIADMAYIYFFVSHPAYRIQ